MGLPVGTTRNCCKSLAPRDVPRSAEADSQQRDLPCLALRHREVFVLGRARLTGGAREAEPPGLGRAYKKIMPSRRLRFEASKFVCAQDIHIREQILRAESIGIRAIRRDQRVENTKYRAESGRNTYKEV